MVTSGLAITGLSKRFGNVVAVDDLSLHVPRGALVGFLGPNGAGKTTTMRSIMGMVRPDAGTITWDGSAVDLSTRTRIGYMPQERGLYPKMKALEQVAYFGVLAGLDRSTAAARAVYWLERVGLEERQDALVQELSGGNQQRVQLAVSLVHDPDLLVLDEPFGGLDPIAAENMRQIIAERAADGASVLFSSHQLDLVEGLCEDVVVVANGHQVASGAIADLRAASPVRVLEVSWAAEVGEWVPPEGTIDQFGGRSARVTLAPGFNTAALLASAEALGPIAAFRVEPPGLDEVFVELAAASRDEAKVSAS